MMHNLKEDIVRLSGRLDEDEEGRNHRMIPGAYSICNCVMAFQDGKYRG
jgi:hypothetical protein